jgi:hypothetical protein
VAFAVLAAAGCNDDQPPGPEPSPLARPAAAGSARALPPPRLRADLARLEAEAGLRDPTDSPPPSGDLRGEIAAFAGLDACARDRVLGDPLLGDVVESMGYDTLVLDACRMLEALKTEDPKPCKSIALSALRARCEISVAVVTRRPELCPMTAPPGRSAARDPACLARASRDDRLCAAALAADRPTCAALVLGDPGKCAGNSVCLRQVARWRTLIEKPADHRPFPARARVDLHGTGETPDPATPSFDLTDTAQQGAVLTRLGGGRTKVAVGSAPPTTVGLKDTQPRLLLEIVVSPADLGKGEHVLGPGQIKIDLLVPGVQDRALTTVADAKLSGCSIGEETGSPVKLTLAATLYEAPKKYAAKIEIETFVRDVVGTK